MRCVSSKCEGMYIFRMVIGVSGLFLIIMIWRYGDIVLVVGILTMFSFVYIDFGSMASIPPRVWEGPLY